MIPILFYGFSLYLLIQAFRLMSVGWKTMEQNEYDRNKKPLPHPEMADVKEGDELLVVNFRELQPPRPEEEIADNLTMHEKMYRIATARNNPFHVGGSENAQSEIDYIKKHSPGGSENFQGGSENVR